HEDGCGCSAGQPEVRETVRERYAAAALASAAGQGCGCGPDIALADQTGAQVFGDALYAGADTEGATDAAISASLGCDVPTAVPEAARVLRPGGRLAVSDVIADPDMDDATRADIRQWTGCIAGALTRSEFEQALRDAGLEDIEIRETHRVHEHAASAIIRARKPLG